MTCRPAVLPVAMGDDTPPSTTNGAKVGDKTPDHMRPLEHPCPICLANEDDASSPNGENNAWMCTLCGGFFCGTRAQPCL
jgi:hypothetical protein